MVEIPAQVLAAICRHAEAAHPRESCGLLIVDRGTGRLRYRPMENADGDQNRFAFDPHEQLAVYADMDANNEDPYAVVHSHPDGPHRLSWPDIENAAATPGVLQVLVWPRFNRQRDVMFYRVEPSGKGYTVTSVEWRVVD